MWMYFISEHLGNFSIYKSFLFLIKSVASMFSLKGNVFWLPLVVFKLSVSLLLHSAHFAHVDFHFWIQMLSFEKQTLSIWKKEPATHIVLLNLYFIIDSLWISLLSDIVYRRTDHLWNKLHLLLWDDIVYDNPSEWAALSTWLFSGSRWTVWYMLT